MLDQTEVPGAHQGRDFPIDDCLSVRDGRLWIEGCEASGLAARFGTPLYVVSENQLRRNARRFVGAFSTRWPGPVNVLPSIKANHVLALRRILSSEGLGCDTFGRSELWAALACGVAPALISVNGTGKSAALVEEAVAAGCRITLDSPPRARPRHRGRPPPRAPGTATSPGAARSFLSREGRFRLQP